MESIEDMFNKYWEELALKNNKTVDEYTIEEYNLLRDSFFAGFNRAYITLYPDLPVDVYSKVSKVYETEMDNHSGE